MSERHVQRVGYIELSIVLDILTTLLFGGVITLDEHERERASFLGAAGWTEDELSIEVDRRWSIDPEGDRELIDALLAGPVWC